VAAGARVLSAAPLLVPATYGAALVVAGPEPPNDAEFTDLARRGAVAIASALVYEERTALASTLRASLEPAPLPDIPGVELAASYRTAQESTQIGGDFYDVTVRADGTWALSIGDVCGKGVDAAVLTGQVRQSLRTAGLVSDDPVRTLRLVNDALVAHGGDNYVTLVYGLIRRVADGIRMRIASGGHPAPFIVGADGVRRVAARGTIVGMLPEVTFTPVEVALRPGDVMLLFTDGAPEARGPRGMLGIEPIERLLADCYDLPAQVVTERVMQLVLEHLGGRSHDDIALLALRCKE
jgi:serine phosphatase RsbU (regulator of sigma subunit)